MSRRTWLFPAAVLALAFVLAALSPLASSKPDGLERVVQDHRLGAGANEPPSPAPMSDYRVPGVRNTNWGTILAGLAGTLAVFGAALGLGRLVSARRRRTVSEGAARAASPPR